MERLSVDDLKKLHSMLADYYDALTRKSVTPSGIPVHLHIANDIVSQAVEPLLAENAALREIVAFVAGEPFHIWPTGYAARLAESDAMQDKARALLGTDGEAQA